MVTERFESVQILGKMVQNGRYKIIAEWLLIVHFLSGGGLGGVWVVGGGYLGGVWGVGGGYLGGVWVVCVCVCVSRGLRSCRRHSGKSPVRSRSRRAGSPG